MTTKPQFELFERLQRIANAMDGVSATLSMNIQNIDFETAAKMWLLGARPCKWSPNGGDDGRSTSGFGVYYTLNIILGNVSFWLYTDSREPLPYEVPAPPIEQSRVPVVVVDERKEQDLSPPSRFSLLEVN